MSGIGMIVLKRARKHAPEPIVDGLMLVRRFWSELASPLMRTNDNGPAVYCRDNERKEWSSRSGRLK